MGYWAQASPQTISTFSIVGAEPRTGEIGIAVASRFLAVGAVVPWARSGVGGVATQAWANLSYGPEGLRLLERGLPPEEVIRRLIDSDEFRDHRQIAVVDTGGRTAVWTGPDCLPWAGQRAGDGFTCQGNLLVGPEVTEAMSTAFQRMSGLLPERLVSALESGQRAGGDSRGQQAAALLVVRDKGSYGGYPDHYIDLRVDDANAPINELLRLLQLHRRRFPETDRPLVLMAGNTVREVQRILARIHLYEGPPTGRYDELTKQAFQRFSRIEKLEHLWRDDDLADREIINYLRHVFGNG